MKTITYNLIDEITDEAYIDILRIIPSLKVEGIKDDDLVFYPLNLDAIKEEKRFLISGNKVAYKYLDDLDYAIERILEAHNISVSREELEKDEK
jgi:hypothetical protein